MIGIVTSPSGVTISLHIVPRASKNQVVGFHGDAVKIRLRAPPVDGKANAALIGYLAESLGVPERAIAILSGETGRRKRVLVQGLDAPTTAARLGLPPPGPA